MLSIGSLFSGIGGFELGLERAGLGPVRWQVEIDEFCTKILEKHWPHGKHRALSCHAPRSQARTRNGTLAYPSPARRSRTDRVGALGNVVVPPVAEAIGHIIRRLMETSA